MEEDSMSTVQIPAKEQQRRKLRFSDRLRRPLNIIVVFLALIGIGAVALHYFIPPISPGFLIYPVAVALHVVAAGIWMTLAPFQFVKRIRARWLNYHRWAGRVLVAVGLIVGLAALFMAWVTPIAGWTERIILGFYGLLFLLALCKGFYSICMGQVMLHREWMIRAFALTLAVSTVRLIEIPALIIAGTQPLQIIYVIANITAFTSHAIVADLWIRATRRKRFAAGAHS
jgi:hypothetical protein